LTAQSVSEFAVLESVLQAKPQRWLVTGAAGFIGSNLTERLLQLGQDVVALDDFSTGSRDNIADMHSLEAPGTLRFIEGSVADPAAVRDACDGVDVVLHQAAIGSVPRSIADPMRTHVANVDGFLCLALAAKAAGVRRFVYASSSSVYGDAAAKTKIESELGRPLSPYAVSKRTGELYAAVIESCYGMECAGLRYFNVFGPRQSPAGPYAAVVPIWIRQLLDGEACVINGDGTTSRDFCFIENVVQANMLAATGELKGEDSRIFNVACGDTTTLLELQSSIVRELERLKVSVQNPSPIHAPFRAGDIRHSLADISAATRALGYRPVVKVSEGLRRTVEWHVSQSA
jgi:UDP-N-acetylglucosamine 4-epimerase